MSKRKVCVVVTARPSYSRCKTLLQAISDHHALELQLVVAGSALLDRYGSAVDIIEADGFNISEKVFNVLEGETSTAMAKTTGIAVIELSSVFFKLEPDVVVTIADRFETLATSIAASYQNIPLAHLQGGEVTGNIDEKVRHANTKLADIHFVASSEAMTRVLKMGEDVNYVFNTGCPSIDLAKEVRYSQTLGFDPVKKYGGVGHDLDWRDGYIVVMQHPVTTELSSSREQILQTLSAIDNYGKPTFWFWPNVDPGSDGIASGIRSYRETNNPKNIHFFKNMEPKDFLKLIKHAEALVGNSSVGIREASYLGVPVVNIGTRQEKRQRSRNVVDCNYEKNEILEAVLTQVKKERPPSEIIYGDGSAGNKIANILGEIYLKSHKTIIY